MRIGRAIFGLALAVSVGVPAVAAEFEGFGQDIPMETAARSIVPEGWTIDYGEGVDRKAAISWSAASSWRAALSSAVARRGYAAQFGTSTVVIAKGPTERVASDPNAAPRRRAAPRPEVDTRRSRESRQAVRQEAAPAEVGGGGFVMRPYREPTKEASKEGFRPYAGKVSKDGQDPAAVTVGFSVSEGDDLRTVIEAWASANGWKAVWNSEFRYPIAAAATFDGDFIAATSALVRAMAEARPVVNIDFYRGNKVVVISNGAADETN